jgi:phosphate transport system substrate-binding protein
LSRNPDPDASLPEAIMPIRLSLPFALVLLAATAVQAADLSALPPYRPQVQVRGTIRTWGHVFVKDVMTAWEQDFRKYQPGVRFDDYLVSSATAIGALYTKTADIGFLGREIRPLELAGYRRVMHCRPYGFQVMTGAYTDPDKCDALALFVARDNPLARLTYRQLDAIFGAQHRRGEPRNIRTWGQLGLTGDWADRPIVIYQGLLDAAPAFYFSQQVMEGSLLWNDHMRLFDDRTTPDGMTVTASQQIVDAVAADRYGLGLAGAGTPNPNVKRLALARTDAGPFVEPTRANVANRSYPLARSAWLYINRPPGQTIAPALREFLTYILSRQGQQDVARAGDFMPLTEALDRAQRRRID